MRILNAEKVQSVAGEYCVGDPGYVMDEASYHKLHKLTDIYDFWASSDRRAVSFPTLGGDGIFYDDSGNRYHVDSGTLGVVPRDAIVVNDSIAHKVDRTLSTFGLPNIVIVRIIRFEAPFICELDDQLHYLRLGKIEIALTG